MKLIPRISPKLKYKLKALFQPLCWGGNYRKAYNKEWDDWLWNALETSNNIVVGYCSSTLDGIEVWHSNHPYASGHSYGEDKGVPLKQCSRATSFFLIDTLTDIYLIQRLKGPYDRFEFREKYGIGFPSNFPH